MLRSGKERFSDFGRLWLELDDYVAMRRRRIFIVGGVMGSVVLALASAICMATSGEDAFAALCTVSLFFVIFGAIFAFASLERVKQVTTKVTFAKELNEAFADDFHPARKITYYIDLRAYDESDKKYWSGRSAHGNSKYKYLDRWYRQKFWLIDGTRVVVERKADHKERKGSVVRHKRRVYVKVFPGPAFGSGPFRGDEDLDDMIKQAIRGSFHDPPEVIRVRKEGDKDHLSVAITQLDAEILGREVVALVEAMLLYLRMRV
ncbi:MAG: hypothetical protein H6737_21900 [Alphaproteobacteria bacterium]|nr:hypothetical protein [Alphaproteobacteria bacterium]